MDPPYFGCETDYGRNMFSRDDFERLATILAEVRGQFLLSLNDTPEGAFNLLGFTIDGVETTYTVAGGGKGSKAGEVFISKAA